MRYGAAEPWSLLKPTWRRGAAAMLEAFLASTVAMATPILYAALGELLVEQSGVINIGIEGAMLAGAFFALAAAYFSDILALGLTGVFYRQMFGVTGSAFVVRQFAAMALGPLARIPVIGRAFFDQNVLVYVAFAMVPILALVISRTRYGLRL